MRTLSARAGGSIRGQTITNRIVYPIWLEAGVSVVACHDVIFANIKPWSRIVVNKKAKRTQKRNENEKTIYVKHYIKEAGSAHCPDNIRWVDLNKFYSYWVMGMFHMMTSSNGNIFRVTGPLCGEFTGHRWIPRTKPSDAEPWCFLWSAPE